MPHLRITTSKSMDADRKHNLLKAASKMVATELGKPEDYMMVSMECPISMLFAGTEEPSAFLDLRSIGLPEAKAGELAKLLCGLMESQTGVRADRTYVTFTDIKPSMWGWNGETF